eukprot:sb/3479168/
MSLVNFVLEHGPITLVDEMMRQVETTSPDPVVMGDGVFFGAPLHDLRVNPKGDKLRGIKGDINVPRFTYDTVYRRTIIMSIAASPQLDMALVLAT